MSMRGAWLTAMLIGVLIICIFSALLLLIAM